MDIVIKVTVEAGGVSAEKNPEAADQTDTITWVFNSGRDDLQVVFKKVEFRNGSSLLLHEQGPFSRPLSRKGRKISGTIAAAAPGGRYLYDIRDGNNQQLTWLNPLSEDQNFGGLDVPKPPRKSQKQRSVD